MKIKAISPWFGSKRNLAKEIIAELGDHRVYWEPFCGSMAVLLLKPKCVMETVNDLHGDLINLARVIKDPHAGTELYRRVRRVWMVEELFNESGDVIRSQIPSEDSVDVDRAFHFLVTTWLGRNGVAGTSNYYSHFCVRYTANGGHAAKRWDSVIQSIPAWRRRLQNVTILSRDAFELLPRIDDAPGTVIYVDPPYVKKGAKYLHDFEGEEAHRKLGKELSRFQNTRVVLSYYANPLLGELYPGWSRREIVVSKALAHQGRRGVNDSKATEVLLMNGPSYTQPQPSGSLFET